MVKKEEEKKYSKWKTQVKIHDDQRAKIDRILQDKSLGYENTTDFIHKAIDTEYEYARMSQELDEISRYRFRELWHNSKWKIYDDCLKWSRGFKNIEKLDGYTEGQLEAENLKN